MTTAIVAGGGIAGLFAAKLLTRRHDRVVLIERDADCGGLLGSVHNSDGVAFDHGAHVLSETGMTEVDQLLFEGLGEDDWHAFRILRAGNWFAGAMNRESPFPDARRIGEETMRIAMTELSEASHRQYAQAPATLAEALERRFGRTLATKVAGPAVRKQLGVDPGQLHPLTPFAIRRLICADAPTSRKLKADPKFSEPLAFASYEEGAGTLLHRYPRNGGIGQWADHFVNGLRDDGVDLFLGRTIANLERDGENITSATLDNGEVVDCDLLAWTLPSALVLRAAGIPCPGGPPTARPVGLFHLVFDEPFCDTNYHVTCYDESMRIFRITLYPNVRGDSLRPPYNCTVEVVGEAGTDFQALLPEVLGELRMMAVVSPSTRLVSNMLHVIPNGFPATTHDFIDGNAAHSSLAEALLRNAVLLGRARCPPFFTTEVLLDAYCKLTADGPM